LSIVRFNNRQGNGQTDPHTFFFGSYEGVKNTLSILQAWSIVLTSIRRAP
jgi:hypothetical protein